jgi:hypothetical protein
MRTVGSWALSILIGLVALVGLITLINSRDKSGVDSSQAVASGPGSPYRGTPPLSAGMKSLLARGNVLVLYRSTQPPAGTRQLVPPGGAELVQAGQAVVLKHDPSLGAPLAAVSSKKVEQANSPAGLQQFVDYWLGGR